MVLSMNSLNSKMLLLSLGAEAVMLGLSVDKGTFKPEVILKLLALIG